MVNHLKKARGENLAEMLWRRNNKKTTKMRTKSAINKKSILKKEMPKSSFNFAVFAQVEIMMRIFGRVQLIKMFSKNIRISKKFCNILAIFVQFGSSGGFDKVVKVMNNTGWWDVELAWYFPSDTH